MNLKKCSIIFSILGISLLYLLSLFCRPLCIDLSEASKYEGKQVITKGTVKEIIETKFKNQIITIQKNNSKIKVFSEEKTNIEYGDFIEVTGMIQQYDDTWEIVVENKENIKILKKWDNISMPLWQISLDPERYLGLNIKVRGHIENIYNSFFYLKSMKTDHKIVVSYEGDKTLYLKSGKEAIVKGVFCFDENNLRYILKICDKTHGISMKG